MKKLFYGFWLCAWAFTVSAQSYHQIHERALVVDTHNDFLSKGIEENLSFDRNLKGKAHSDLHRMLTGGVDVQIFSIFCDDHYGKGSAFAFANREIDSLYAVVKRNPQKMQLVSNPVSLL